MLLQFASRAYRKTESKGSTARGLGQAAVGDQEQRTGRHDSGQAWFSSSRPPCTQCHNIHGRRSTGTGTRWSLGSAEAAGSSHSHSTGLLPARSWEGAAVARSRAGSSWHRAERGPRVPSAPARTGCSRPCRRLLPGSVSHAPVCCRPLHPPLTPSHLSQSSPKSPEPPPARRCLAAVRVFPAAAPLCQSADFQRLHDPCGSLSAREIFRIYDCKQPRLSCTPIIHTQRLRLQAEMRTQMEWDGQTGLQVMPPLSALPWQRALSSTPFL